MKTLKISQSLVKEVQKADHCPKQVYYSFVEQIEIEDIPDGWKMGRYFETELLGYSRGGEKQEAALVGVKSLKPNKGSSKSDMLSYIEKHDFTGFEIESKTNKDLFKFIDEEMPEHYTEGEKATAYKDCDDLVLFAKEVFKNLGLDVNEGQSQVYLESELLSGNIDHVNKDIGDFSRKANYDVKWTATAIDDRWNGWGLPEEKQDAITQALHYTLLTHEVTGEWYPFYFLVFGKSNWVRVIRYQFEHETMEHYKQTLSNVGATILDYAKNNYKGKGDFNKCAACAFKEQCPDKSTKINIESYQI